VRCRQDNQDNATTTTSHRLANRSQFRCCFERCDSPESDPPLFDCGLSPTPPRPAAKRERRKDGSKEPVLRGDRSGLFLPPQGDRVFLGGLASQQIDYSICQKSIDIIEREFHDCSTKGLCTNITSSKDKNEVSLAKTKGLGD
jgi:hypothetical protein